MTCCRCITLLLAVSLHPGVFGAEKSPIRLDIGRQTNYRSTGQEIDVKSHKDGEETFYTHTLSKPAHLSDIMVDGHYIHADLFPFKDELILSSLVYWRYDKPDMLTLNLERSQVFLWNNGNGRLVPQASTFGEEVDNEVTIDISSSTSYTKNGKSVKVKQLSSTLHPNYAVYCHTADVFVVKEIVFEGKIQRGLHIGCKVFSVQVYKWADKPLLVEFELFNSRVKAFARIGEQWVPFNIPDISSPKRKWYMRGFLEYISCRNKHGVSLDIGKMSNGSYRDRKCGFRNLPKYDSEPISLKVYTGRDLAGYKKITHTPAVVPFDLQRVAIALPNGSHEIVFMNVPNKPVKQFSVFCNGNKPLYIEVHADKYYYYSYSGGNAWALSGFSMQPASSSAVVSVLNFLKRKRT
ncbi:signal peptide containing protein [Theileria equi strain WA]|uniref:Signal peptide containing protein n=1 Tax=Theileria equi strain WA TaxID=1537102 RepID=L1LEJ5_THEEQ|nr:signal peptide containing protein [Theileria equi strain WA]EKX73675.1 signal peptide containing protein [Theileria equi strain WA]|eukprot:XP_004833127.1 signal peptide containing protein [Theileria equi strain WA]